MAKQKSTTTLAKYDGDDLGGLVLGRIDDDLVIVAETDLDGGPYSWDQAMEELEGSGWQLPSRLEASLITDRTEQVPGLDAEKWYWTRDERDSTNAWYQKVSGASAGYQNYDYKTYANSYVGVRPVRRVSALDLPLGEVEQSETEATSVMIDAIEVVRELTEHYRRGFLDGFAEASK